MVDIQSLINRNFEILAEECSEFFQLIESGDFNATKLWLAYKLKVTKQNDDTYDFSVLKGPF